jgi:DNA adenine methylase
LKLIENTQIDIATWEKMQIFLNYKSIVTSELPEMAFACLFLNRTCFSGIINSGPIGGINQNSKYSISCRFNKNNLISTINAVSIMSSRYDVVFNDAITYLHKNKCRIENMNSLVYIDPPYLQQGNKLYRYFYLKKDHERLANFIRFQKFPWLVSYDDHPTILNLFKGNKILTLYLNYAVRQSRNARELLISNMNLPLSDVKYRANLLPQFQIA